MKTSECGICYKQNKKNELICARNVRLIRCVTHLDFGMKQYINIIKIDIIMKPNELMIGDWVYCHQSECKGHQIDYISLMDEEVGADGEIYGFDDIEPIPLTTEILEKNGFEIEHGYTYDVLVLEDFDENYRCVFHPKDKNYTRNTYNYIHLDYGCINIEEFPLEYVHELQHVLKLCKIKKNIELC